MESNKNIIKNKTPQVKKNLDAFFWGVTVFVVVLGIVANHYFSDVAVAIRVAAWIVLTCIVIVLISQTTQGRGFLVFAKDARTELYKVVWPNRQETVQMTMVIAGLVVAVSLIIWCVDSVLVAAIGWLNS